MAQRTPRAYRLLRGMFWAVALILAGRLIQIQFFGHDFYLRCAKRQWEKKVTIPAPRGNLYDRQGGPLAVSSESFRLSTDPNWFQKADGERQEQLLELLSPILDRSAASLRRSLERSKKRWLLLGEELQLSALEKAAMEETGLLTLKRVSQRLYPQGSTGAALIGFLGSEGEGGSGLERSLQDALAGQPGEALVQKDDLGRSRRSQRNRVLREPVRGSDVFLSLDRKVQAIAEAELVAAVRKSEARSGCVVVLDPRNGDLLALASWPAPEKRNGKYDAEEWALLPLQAVYEPGSTMKALTSIALIESGGVDENSQVNAEDGTAVVAGFTIHDDKPHPGWRSFREAFTLSSNICFAKMADSLITDEQLFTVFRDAGFGNRFGLDYPGEQDGILRSPGVWSGRSRITLAFGQEMSVTPLQLTAAFGALARGGRLMRPRLIRALRHPDGEWERREPVFMRKICREATAARIRDLMGEVVSSGTGTKAQIPGISAGGKTGTAQKFEGGSLKHGKYLASFVGLVPLEDPTLVIGVFLDEPSWGMHHGGQSAAPVFAGIAARLAVTTPYLRPAVTGAEPGLAALPAGPPVPSFLELDPEEAGLMALREGLSVMLRGQGQRVVGQEPSPGAPLSPGERIRLILGDPIRPDEEPPSLIGCTLRQARRKALAGGYELLPNGSGVVTKQEKPRAGVIRVELGRPKR